MAHWFGDIIHPVRVFVIILKVINGGFRLADPPPRVSPRTRSSASFHLSPSFAKVAQIIELQCSKTFLVNLKQYCPPTDIQLLTVSVKKIKEIEIKQFGPFAVRARKSALA